jgi:hypothetical protein
LEVGGKGSGGLALSLFEESEVAIGSKVDVNS